MLICAYVPISMLYLNHWIFLQHTTQLTMVSFYNNWNTHTYGISGNLYHWFKSYLHNKHLKVCINSSFSKSHNLKCGVHQGSVLGERLYTVYVGRYLQYMRATLSPTITMQMTLNCTFNVTILKSQSVVLSSI